jgi:hypothetical protein
VNANLNTDEAKRTDRGYYTRVIDRASQLWEPLGPSGGRA